jgi:large subunit ribosomal protein L9
MEVILREHVENLGQRGDVVKVANGYARNYLLPRKLALTVTEGNRKQIERERKVAETREAEERHSAEAIATRLADVVVTIQRRVGETEALYGSVTSADIAESLAAKGFEIERRRSSSWASSRWRFGCTATSPPPCTSSSRKRGSNPSTIVSKCQGPGIAPGPFLFAPLSLHCIARAIVGRDTPGPTSTRTSIPKTFSRPRTSRCPTSLFPNVRCPTISRPRSRCSARS